MRQDFHILKDQEPYQAEALSKMEKQIINKGMFAMATGTGKTITSLNCLLKIYKKTGYYQCINISSNNDIG